MSSGHRHRVGARAHRRLPTDVRAAAALALSLAALLALGLSPRTSGSPEPYPAIPSAQPVLGAPEGMTLIGASPAEAPGETWGYTSSGFTIMRYSDETDNWRSYASPLDGEGHPLEGFTPAAGPLAGSVTPGGGVAVVGEAGGAGEVLVRDPGGQFREVPTLTAESAPAGAVDKLKEADEPKGAGEPTEGSGEAGKSEPNALLKSGETLSAPSGEGVLMSTVEEQPGGLTAVFLVPFESSSAQVQEDVLFYDGKDWTREPICVGLNSKDQPVEPCVKPVPGFKVLGIGASSAQNAWLLAQSGSPTEGIVLFRREISGAGVRWTQRSLGSAGSLGAQFAQAKLSFENASHETVGVQVSALANGQPLTVTSQGVWVDGQLGVEIPHKPRQTDSFTLYYDITKGVVSASWCSPLAEAGAEAAQLCTEPLESNLPGGAYRSFAWTGDEPFGERVITGLGEGVSLSLHGETFKRVLGIGGEAGTSAGAAFSSPEEGWLAGPLTHLTTSPEPDRVQPWPVPFHRPLTAIAEQPGASPGELGAEALAVGDEGQVARYIPGQGWVPESLLNSDGEAPRETQAHDLRGVAWPTPDRAFAVGTHGEMWLWREETGLWEHDPARPPNLFLANFTGIAFDPSEPLRGYAIGQQGVLLRYGKTWQQETLPEGLAGPDGANFTSIAFAGNEALAIYQVPDPPGGRGYTGGVLVNYGNGSGWQIDAEADAALGQLTVPVRVAGLPDGGAVLATARGEVIERQGPGQPWQPAPAGGVSGFPVALAAFREDGALRAVLSIEPVQESVGLAQDFTGDEVLQEPRPEGQAPVVTAPYPLPASGFLLRETASGWRDEEHAAYPAPDHEKGRVDWPVLPDAVLALALAPDGEAGWAVGGQTGKINNSMGSPAVEAIQTAGVMRYPASGVAPTGFSSSPEQTSSNDATFAIGGGAQCATACADLAEDDLGPDAWLTNAITRAGETPGVRDFLYMGPHLASGLGGLEPAAFEREQASYSELLTQGKEEALRSEGQASKEEREAFEREGSLQGVFAAPSESDLYGEGGLSAFDAAMEGTHTPSTAEEAPPTPPPGSGYSAHAFESTGPEGAVRVIVLDYSHSSLGEEQECWLARQLAQAREQDKGHGVPAIVIGNRGVDSPSNGAADSSQVAPILVAGTPPPGEKCREEFAAENLLPAPPAGASAYFYDAPEQDLISSIALPGAPPVPEFGDGTLGYVKEDAQKRGEFFGAGGFLLAEVNTALADREADNRFKVKVRLIPDISDLALDATGGVLLRRSRPALFTALARRPHAGLECQQEGDGCLFSPDPYVPIPSLCQGVGCASGLFPEYTFTSSEPSVGQFVEADPAEAKGESVLHGANGKPIPDEPRISQGPGKGELTADGRFEENSRGEPLNEGGDVVPHEESGLFCAYNSTSVRNPMTGQMENKPITVTVKAGGLSYSEQVTVRAGSVEQPCGTVPLRHPPVATQQAALPVPPPAPAPAPAVTPHGTLTPPPAPPAPAVVVPTLVPHVQHRPAPTPPVISPPPAQLYPIVALVPPPAPAAARPTPPSGTAQVPAQSPVSQPVGVAEHEEEQQGATEIVHHMVAYERPSEAPLPSWPLGLVLLAVAAGVGLRRPRAQLAHAEAPRRGRRQP
jgi:hypothetical protein